MGCLSVFIGREPVSHLLTGQSRYTFSVLSGRKTGQMSLLYGIVKGQGMLLGRALGHGNGHIVTER